MAGAHHPTAGEDQLHLGQLAPKLVRLGFLLLAVGLGTGTALLMTGAVEAKAFAHAYLVAVVYFITLSLGALFFVQVQHLTRAGWSVTVRRLAEIVAAGLPFMALFLIPVVLGVLKGRTDLYVWADAAHVAGDALLRKKAAYLNPTFFAVRFGVYITAWAVFSRFFLRGSRLQDHDGSLEHSYTMQWVAAPATAVFALSATFFAFDFIMALEPSFYSTVFGVYMFAGGFMASLCTVTLLAKYLQRNGVLATSITREHFHDLGKLTFGFVFFWGYIAFSQYMLIWYGNIPEETQWFLRRQTDNWLWVSTGLLVGHLLLPFPGLLSRHVKRSSFGLAFWACWLLGMHYLDLYWLIMPSAASIPGPHDSFTMQPPKFGLLEVSLWVGMAGAFLLHFALRAQKMPLRPLRDPRLAESLAFENT